MKATELRIGNLVWVSDTVTNLVFREEQEINIHNLMDLTGYKVDPICEYEPILLTDEWLRKFGFKYRNSGIGGQDGWAGYGTWELGNIYFQGTRKGDVIYFSRISETEKFYVHQLQNLYFALTGSELEIK